MKTIFHAGFALQKKIGLLLLISFLSLCFISWIIYFNEKGYESTRWWISHTHSVIGAIEKMSARISTWESLSRPPLSSDFHRQLQNDLGEIKELTTDNPVQQELVLRLSLAIDSLYADGREVHAIAARSVIDQMVKLEDDLLERRRISNRVSSNQSTWMLVGESVLGFLLFSGLLLWLNRDILLRRRVERQLQDNQTWLDSILDNTTSLIYIKDLSGRYVMANRRLREVLGLTDKTVIGKTNAELFMGAEALHYGETDDEVIRTGKMVETEEVITRPGGEIYLLSMKFPLLDGNGRMIGIGGIATEITERVHFQQQLIAATHAAQAAKGMQELFLANMSHEIRTPMNGIQGMTDLLLDTPLNDQQRDFATTIKRSVSNLLVIVNDVLDFSKIQAGKLAMEKIDFRLNDVLGNIKAMFAHRIARKGLQLLVSTDPRIPETLNGDPYRLNQVLINLIGNAIKFTETGWIKIEVSAQERTRSQVNLLFSVSDSGIGIPEASLPFIFEHFSQAGLDISRRFGGTGLGLAICHRLLQLQGGEISVKSREREGTTFVFRLSYGYKGRVEAGVAPSPALSDESFRQSLAGRKFLVAEDNEVNQQLIDQVLKRGGGQVRLTSNGEEALSFLRRGENYDLIIMDLQMPVMDGYAATRCIRQELQLSTPILAMTASAMLDEQLRCLEVGMNDYMTKPFEFADLYKRINTLLAPACRR